MSEYGNLSSIGHLGNITNHVEDDQNLSGETLNLYESFMSGKSEALKLMGPKSLDENKQLESFIEEVLNSNTMHCLTFGLSTIFKASGSCIDISSLAILKFIDISSMTSGLRLPTPAKSLFTKRGKTR